ncbi:GNAT family N-acetyltransferase [Lusitaniella coriacea]|uniref:GNAT family N-acetyltransferase n=1 Tax=Lusitaniella coriacea TaxID=1983105 RepID=UPI003CF2B0B4
MIRIAETPNDIDIVSSLAGEIWREHYISIIGSAQVEYMLQEFQSVEAISKQIAEGYKYFVISSDGIDCGYSSAKILDREIFLSKLYVKATFRGKGLGREALKFIEFRFNPEVIRLTVNKNNTNSIAAYKKMGFEIVDEVVKDIGNGFVMDDFVLKKWVNKHS